VKKTRAELDEDITRHRLAVAIRKRLKLGDPPCYAARHAIRALDLPIGVQGDDDEPGIKRGDDPVELHYNDGRNSAGPVMSLRFDYDSGKWSVWGG
jgi:hypothetical protein